MEAFPSHVLADTATRLERESSASYGFLGKVGGVVPGYSGHRPGHQHVYFKSATGGVPAVGGGQRQREPVGGTQGQMLGQGTRGKEARETTAWREIGTSWKPPDDTKLKSANQQYLASSGGVKTGYTGFVPHARRHFGSSHRGGVDGPDGAHNQIPSDARIAAAQGAKGIEAGGNMGTLQTPSMIEEVTGIHPRTPAPRMDPNGGAILGYGGHRPRHAFEDAHGRKVDSYRGSPMIAQQTPHRRGHRALPGKVGARPQQQWVPPPKRSLTPPPSWRDSDPGEGGAAGQLDEFLAKSTTMKGIVTNDWLVHQAEPPPSLPASSRTYRRSVGGIVPGWQGFVPHSAAHCGSSHVGMRASGASLERPKSAGEQRGHIGKTSGGELFRQHDDNSTSTIAAGAVLGYAGHLPSALHAFGVSAWTSPSKQAADDAMRDSYSA